MCFTSSLFFLLQNVTGSITLSVITWAIILMLYNGIIQQLSEH